MWVAANSISSGTVTQLSQTSTVPLGYTAAAQLFASAAVAATAAGNFALLSHKLEGYRMARLLWGGANAKSINMAFWVYATGTGTFSIALRNATVARSYVTTVTVTTANAWQYVTLTIPGDTSGTWDITTGVGADVTFTAVPSSNGAPTLGTTTLNAWQAANVVFSSSQTNFLSATNDSFFITGLVVVPSEITLPTSAFAYLMLRDFDAEFDACRRYWQQLPASFNIGTSNSPSAGFMLGTFPVAMRAAPTCTLNGTSTISINFFGVGAATSTSYILTGFVGGVTINANTLLPTRTASIPIICDVAINCDARL